VITLMVNAYAEDPQPAIDSARDWIGAIDRTVVVHGRYEGFPELAGGFGHVYRSEHVKRNHMLAQAAAWASPERWLLWLDCDERVTYATPQLAGQLARVRGDVAGLRFVEPLPPEAFVSLVPGLGAPGRSFRDSVTACFGGRLVRHLPQLEYVHRHDHLVDRASGRLLMGWASEGVEPVVQTVDLQIAHLWWMQPASRRSAKQGFYSGAERTAESRAWR
jgi:hypothetical protein